MGRHAEVQLPWQSTRSRAAEKASVTDADPWDLASQQSFRLGMSLLQLFAHYSILLPLKNPAQDQCVYIRGFRGKRVFWTRSIRAAAEPRPDDTDNSRGDEIQ